MNVDILRRLLRKSTSWRRPPAARNVWPRCLTFKPQLVLLDIMMPGIDGYETCRRIKSSAIGDFVQVILVSGKGSTGERVRGYEAQADDYVVKPFDHEELLSKVRVQFRLLDTQWQLTLARDRVGNLRQRTGRTRVAPHQPVVGHPGYGRFCTGQSGGFARSGDRGTPATDAASMRR